MRQKHILRIYALRSSMDISQRLYSSNTVRRAFKNSSLEHLGLFEEHLKTIWCVIAARSRYGIGRDDDESKLA